MQIAFSCSHGGFNSPSNLQSLQRGYRSTLVIPQHANRHLSSVQACPISFNIRSFPVTAGYKKKPSNLEMDQPCDTSSSSGSGEPATGDEIEKKVFSVSGFQVGSFVHITLPF